MVSRTPQCLQTLAVLVVVAILVMAGIGAPGRGQPAPIQDAFKKAAGGPTPAFFSANDCARCHRSPDAAPGLVPEGERLAALVRLDEFPTWNEQDQHRRAFDALSGARATRMAAMLGIRDVKTERACLTCHGTGFLPSDPDAEASGAVAWREQGVACIACHGSFKEWVVNHGTGEQLIREWRAKPLREKSEVYGITNLRDPATRTRVCASCHVGNADESKLVTHAMYAAGHPPLPAFEVATFSAAMPPHWYKPDDVPLFRVEPAQRARYGFEPRELMDTKLVVIGGVSVFHESMKLLIAQAEYRPGPEHPLRDVWPDFTQLDCYACHHELASPGYLSWRQMAAGRFRFDGLEVRGVAGRPQFRPWSLALLRVVLTQGATAAPGRGRESTPQRRPHSVRRRVQRSTVW